MTPEDRVTPEEALRKQVELRARLAASKAEREERDARVAAWRAERMARPVQPPVAEVEEELSLEQWLDDRRARRRVVEAERDKADQARNDYRKYIRNRNNTLFLVGFVVWFVVVFFVAPGMGREGTVAIGVVAGVAAMFWHQERQEKAILSERCQSLRSAVDDAASLKTLDKVSEVLNEAVRIDEVSKRPAI